MFEAVRKARAGNEKGFTLIELMIVVAIIGILAAIAIPQFSAYRERAYIASQKADCHNIRIAEEAYFVDNDCYTDTINNLADFGFNNASAGNDPSVAVTKVDDGTDTFEVTVKSDNTDKDVVYNSADGKTEVVAGT
jgi:type IV pilus assembly protein PilA